MNTTSHSGAPALQACKPNPSGQMVPAATGVFLHTGWRSSGTWLWSRCREQPGVHAFYEPLHENIAALRRSTIPKVGPNTWRSRHGDTAPYFAEYGELIAPGGTGVMLYKRRFAFDNFFLDPDEDDPALDAYLRSLLTAPGSAGQAVVVKFCRSLGRVGWMERRFPDMMHAVVLRDPLEQWRSGERLLAQTRNRYFTIAPILVLARNAGHPLVRQACDALDVRLPVLASPDMAYGQETTWRHVSRQDMTDRYRGFLAYWTVTALTALNSRAMLIDTALMARSALHRDAVADAFAASLGLRLDLASGVVQGGDLPGLPVPGLTRAHDDAAGFAAASGGTLAASRLARLLDCLAVDGVPARPSVARARSACQSPGLTDGRAKVAAMVLSARALKVLRRLHGIMRRG